MRHDIDYSVCQNKGENVRQCKNTADKKVVASLDALPWGKRHWGHAIARNIINTKQKLGLGIKPKKPSNKKK